MPFHSPKSYKNVSSDYQNSCSRHPNDVGSSSLVHLQGELADGHFSSVSLHQHIEMTWDPASTEFWRNENKGQKRQRHNNTTENTHKIVHRPHLLRSQQRLHAKTNVNMHTYHQKAIVQPDWMHLSGRDSTAKFQMRWYQKWKKTEWFQNNWCFHTHEFPNGTKLEGSEIVKCWKGCFTTTLHAPTNDTYTWGYWGLLWHSSMTRSRSKRNYMSIALTIVDSQQFLPSSMLILC